MKLKSQDLKDLKYSFKGIFLQVSETLDFYLSIRNYVFLQLKFMLSLTLLHTNSNIHRLIISSKREGTFIFTFLSPTCDYSSRWSILLLLLCNLHKDRNFLYFVHSYNPSN